MKGQTYFTPSDCVFVRNGDQVMGAGYPINNLFLQQKMAPLAVDNSNLNAADEALVSQLFTGDLAVPLGLFIENINCSSSRDIPSDGDLQLMPEPLHDKLLSMVEIKRPTSIKSTTRRRKRSSTSKTRRSS